MNILIGGKAGAGIKEAGKMLAQVLASMGYSVFGYVDYPSLIRGGHNFVILRFSEKDIYSVDRKVDIIVATDRRSVNLHTVSSKENTLWIVDEKIDMSNALKAPFKEVAPAFFKSSSILGVILKVLGISPEKGIPVVERLPQRDRNFFIYTEAYKSVPSLFKIEDKKIKKGIITTGNECIALGAVDGGLDFYVAYPMTPATSVLHYLAERQKELGIKAVHPENEIAVISMAVGIAYAGKRVMIGTSGGGFALMTETLSLSGMAEIPLVIYEAQRAGPSTGVPTYTSQSDLLFSLFAGHGEFPRVVIAPGYPQEAYYLARLAMNIAWKYQIPVILIGDKHLGESYFTVNLNRERVVENPIMWDKKEEYKRYCFTENGISPLAFPGTPGAVVKVTSYEHNEKGLTVESAESVLLMQDKRLRKLRTIKEQLLKNEKTVMISEYGKSDIALITWGSTAGVVEEVAKEMDLKVIRPLFIEPFPAQEVKRAIADVRRIVVVECSASGQLDKVLSMNGIKFHKTLRKYDGRPFFRDELKRILEKL